VKPKTIDDDEIDNVHPIFVDDDKALSVFGECRGWVFTKLPNGRWRQDRKATDAEMTRADLLADLQNKLADMADIVMADLDDDEIDE